MSRIKYKDQHLGKNRYFYAVGLVCIAIIVAFTAYFVGNELFFHHGRHHQSHQQKTVSTYNFHDYLHQQLSTDGKQAQKLAPLEKQYIQQRRALEQDIQQANIQLVQAMQQHTSYDLAIQQAITMIHELQGRLQQLTIQHVYDVRALLTPEQAKALDQFVATAITSGSVKRTP